MLAVLLAARGMPVRRSATSVIVRAANDLCGLFEGRFFAALRSDRLGGFRPAFGWCALPRLIFDARRRRDRWAVRALSQQSSYRIANRQLPEHTAIASEGIVFLSQLRSHASGGVGQRWGKAVERPVDLAEFGTERSQRRQTFDFG
jgi:hypothetical protein